MDTSLAETAVDTLRFTTAGSVDDGKSTLIGRLLHDTRSIFDDQWEQIARAGRRHGESDPDLALITDGLRAEREQKITIDVAYRYFTTSRRRFIIADTPGHLQYTRNMVTGASTADLAVILVDVERGVVTQSKRHAFLSALLGIPSLVVAVNKMDRVNFAEEPFSRIRSEFASFAGKLEGVREISYVPLSALRGDNVVSRSRRMPWYEGETLLERLESAKAGVRLNREEFRFPVQLVLRPHQEFRGYAGTVASGFVEPGTRVSVLPSGEETTIRTIETFHGPVSRAEAGDAVVLTTEEEVDIARGTILAGLDSPPLVGTSLVTDLCWMSRDPLDPGRTYTMLQTTRRISVRLGGIDHRVDVDTLHRTPAETFRLNELGRARLTATSPAVFDPYSRNVATGSFVLVDPVTKGTVAAGMLRGLTPVVGEGPPPAPTSPDVTWEAPAIPLADRERENGHHAAVVWFTGVPAAGKTSIAQRVEELLFRRRVRTVVLDGDRLRHGLSGDLGFSDADRSENLRRAGFVARTFYDHGEVVLCAFVSPRRVDRRRVRELFPQNRFFEVHVHAPPEVVRDRDPKGLYFREGKGETAPLPGSRGSYEPPEVPDLELDTSLLSLDGSGSEVLRLLEEAGIIPRLDDRKEKR